MAVTWKKLAYVDDIFPDGIWVDVMNGVPGTEWPIGSPSMPVDNLTDAFTIAAARRTLHIYCVENLFNSDELVLPSDLDLSYYFEGLSRVQNEICLNGKNVDGSLFRNLLVYGTGLGEVATEHCSLEGITLGWVQAHDCIIGGAINLSLGALLIDCVSPRTRVINLTLATESFPLTLINVSGSIEIAHLHYDDAQEVNIYGGNLNLIIQISCTRGIINVYNDVNIINDSVSQFSGTHSGGTHATVLHPAAPTFHSGSLVGLTVNNVTDGSSGVITANTSTDVTVAALIGGSDNQWENGDAFTINTTIVVNDYTNKPRAEVAVNITAVNASETNFLNLATADFHYTLEDLVLKCADPSVNTVNVRLYKLVNGGSTLTNTFAITTANFASYFSIHDMFGRAILAGDNIKITVQATAGGPYAVTGSYAYRSG